MNYTKISVTILAVVVFMVPGLMGKLLFAETPEETKARLLEEKRQQRTNAQKEKQRQKGEQRRQNQKEQRSQERQEQRRQQQQGRRRQQQQEQRQQQRQDQKSQQWQERSQPQRSGQKSSSGSQAKPGGMPYSGRQSGDGSGSPGSMKFPSGNKGFQKTRTVYRLPDGFEHGPGRSTPLTRGQGDAVLHDVNSARSRLGGVNGRPIPPGEVLANKDGSLTVRGAQGHNYQLRSDGTVASLTVGRDTAHFRPDGSIREMHAGAMVINHGPRNERTIRTLRPDNSVLVSMGPHRGYLERHVMFRNREYFRREYVMNGRRSVRLYTPSVYRGIEYPRYLPPCYYAPAYYGWAYNPWPAPVTYPWGWYRDPWYGHYDWYFKPLPFYPSASLWFADYMLAETLRIAYQEQLNQERGMQMQYTPAAHPISPEVREMISLEVQRQLAQERQMAENPNGIAAPGTLSNTLSEPDRVLVVPNSLNIVANSGTECGLTPGDVIKLYGIPPESAQTAAVLVLSSKPNECMVNSVVAVPLGDIQEMSNVMRENLYSGLETLRQNRGMGGMPAPPHDAMAPPRPTEAAGLAEGGSDNVAGMLLAQQGEADQAEKNFMDSAFN